MREDCGSWLEKPTMPSPRRVPEYRQNTIVSESYLFYKAQSLYRNNNRLYKQIRSLLRECPLRFHKSKVENPC